MHFSEIPTALYQRPGGLTNQEPSFFMNTSILIQKQAWINTILMPADTSDSVVWYNYWKGL